MHSVYHRPNGWDYDPSGAKIPAASRACGATIICWKSLLLVTRMAEAKLLHVLLDASCAARKEAMQMEDKVALVTGGARGIGLGIALSLAQDGFTSRSPAGAAGEECKPALDRIRERSRALHLCAGRCVEWLPIARGLLLAVEETLRPARRAGQQRGHRAARARRHPGSAGRKLRRADRDQSQRTVLPDAGRCGVDDPAAARATPRRIARSSTSARSRPPWPA